MKISKTRQVLLFLAAALAGAGLHFLFQFVPVWPAAILSPVQESLWEHVKLLLWPCLAVSVYLYLRFQLPVQPRLAAMLLCVGLLLAISYGYHILLGGDSPAVDIGLYILLMAGCFALPRVLEDLPGRWRQAVIPLTAVLVVLAVLFTFFPPRGILFTDLRGANTWSRIPC